MSWTSDLVTGLAEHLAAQGVGTFNPTGVYTSGQTGIYFAVMPPGDPASSGWDRAIILTDYDPNGGNSSGDVASRVQVRCRGLRNDPFSAVNIAAAVRDAIDGLEHVTFGSVEVSGINHISGVPMGVDKNDRHERSDNYDIQARRVTALRTE
jgi:hypothetical protein